MSVAATDWTAILTAIVGVSGVVFGSVLTFLGTWLVARRQGEDEREERLDAHRDARQKIYVRFLNEERSVFAPLSSGDANQRAKLEKDPRWLDPLFEPLNEVMVAGTQAVARAARDVQQDLEEVGRAGASDTEARKRCALRVEQLVDAMRADVAPDSKPVGSRRRHRGPI